MTSADFVLLAIVAVSAFVAFVRGFVREVLGIAAWAAAAYVAWRGYPVANPYVLGWIPNKQFADIATYGIVFVLALIIFTIITNIIGRAVRGSVLGGLDRTLGLAYGVLRGALIGIIAYIVAGMAIPPAQWPQPVRQARLLPFAHDGAVWLAGLLPGGFRPRVASLDEKKLLPLPRLLTPAVIGAAASAVGNAAGAALPVGTPSAASTSSPATSSPATSSPGASPAAPAPTPGVPAIPPAFATPSAGAAPAKP